MGGETGIETDAAGGSGVNAPDSISTQWRLGHRAAHPVELQDGLLALAVPDRIGNARTDARLSTGLGLHCRGGQRRFDQFAGQVR